MSPLWVFPVALILNACIGKNIREVDTEQSAEMLTCMGFCYQVELGAAAEAVGDDDVADIEDALEDIKMIEEATQKDIIQGAEQIEKMDEEIKKVRELDKAIYKDDSKLKEIVE
jgi:hypothetical protein